MIFENMQGESADKTRSFLDTDILLGYYRGDQDVAHLFDESVLEKTRYSVSPIVIQGLLLGLDESKLERVNFDEISKLMVIIPYDEIVDEANRPRELDSLSHADSAIHVNDYLNLLAARRTRCEFFITRDLRLLDLRRISSMQIVTPAAFLQAETVA